MSEKKMVRRSVAIALGIMCIVLVAGLAGTVVFVNVQITSLQGQVSDLNRIVTFQKTEIWLDNKTLTINPNQNVTEIFYAPLGGNVEVVGSFQPPNPNYWINLSWYVTYDVGSSTGPVYTVYPIPSIRSGWAGYFDYEFPIVSFAQTWTNPNVELIIGNSNPALTSVVNFTVSFTY
jgi:hypothetical protein